MLADQLDYVVGVDPHRDVHALAVVHVVSGVVVFDACVAADSGGYDEALRLAEQHAPGRRAFAVEGIGEDGELGVCWLARDALLECPAEAIGFVHRLIEDALGEGARGFDVLDVV